MVAACGGQISMPGARSMYPSCARRPRTEPDQSPTRVLPLFIPLFNPPRGYGALCRNFPLFT